MKNIKRIMTLMLAMIMTFGSVTMTSYAARIKITSISLEVESDIQVGQDINMSEVYVTTRSNKYSVGDVTITNDSFEWQDDDIPTLEVRLEAADDHYFSVTASNIKIKGATYVTGKREDSTHLLLTLKLSPLKEQAGAIAEAGWRSETVASWSESANVGNYEVRLYRDGTNVKMTQITTTNSLDMGPCMTKAGTYTYKVRAVNKVNADNTSPWVESGTIEVSNELAIRMREKYGSLTSGLSEPGQENGSGNGATQSVAAGWQKTDKGWWYRNQGGSYTSNNWQQIDNKWYYFDSNGYMVTGWVQWKDKWYYCDLTDGFMLTSALTPDGLRVDSQGVWIQ